LIKFSTNLGLFLNECKTDQTKISSDYIDIYFQVNSFR
jgi:hypothetical protein